MKDFRGLFEVGIGAGCIHQTELGQPTKEGHIALYVVDEIGECSPAIMDVGVSHHRRGRKQENRELIYEIPHSRTRSFPSNVEVCGQIVLFDIDASTEISSLDSIGIMSPLCIH